MIVHVGRVAIQSPPNDRPGWGGVGLTFVAGRLTDVPEPSTRHHSTDPHHSKGPRRSDHDAVVDPWIDRLTGDGDVRDAAIAELRDYLMRGMSRPMAIRYGGGLQPDDVVQDALLKILESLDQFAGRSRFTTWAMTIAMRIAISEMRRKHYQDVSIESFQSDDGQRVELAIDDAVEVADGVDRGAMMIHLQRLIENELTAKQRFAIRGQLEGMPVEVIAEKSQSNRNSVYKLIHDARIKLLAGMKAGGFSADDFAQTFS